jgi:hypothetical protein
MKVFDWIKGLAGENPESSGAVHGNLTHFKLVNVNVTVMGGTLSTTEDRTSRSNNHANCLLVICFRFNKKLLQEDDTWPIPNYTTSDLHRSLSLW